MRADIKNISCDEFDTRTFSPDDVTYFSITVRIRIGLPNSSAADDFELHVCTPKWLEEHLWEPRWGRHLLIVREYNFGSIEEYIKNYTAQCEDSDWDAIANKLARMFAWEFEDYIS